MNDFYNTVYLSEHFDRQNRTQAEGQVDNSQILEPIEVNTLHSQCKTLKEQSQSVISAVASDPISDQQATDVSSLFLLLTIKNHPLTSGAEPRYRMKLETTDPRDGYAVHYFDFHRQVDCLLAEKLPVHKNQSNMGSSSNRVRFVIMIDGDGSAGEEFADVTLDDATFDDWLSFTVQRCLEPGNARGKSFACPLRLSVCCLVSEAQLRQQSEALRPEASPLTSLHGSASAGSLGGSSFLTKEALAAVENDALTAGDSLPRRYPLYTIVDLFTLVTGPTGIANNTRSSLSAVSNLQRQGWRIRGVVVQACRESVGRNGGRVGVMEIQDEDKSHAHGLITLKSFDESVIRDMKAKLSLRHVIEVSNAACLLKNDADRRYQTNAHPCWLRLDRNLSRIDIVNIVPQLNSELSTTPAPSRGLAIHNHITMPSSSAAKTPFRPGGSTGTPFASVTQMTSGQGVSYFQRDSTVSGSHSSATLQSPPSSGQGSGGLSMAPGSSLHSSSSSHGSARPHNPHTIAVHRKTQFVNQSFPVQQHPPNLLNLAPLPTASHTSRPTDVASLYNVTSKQVIESRDGVVERDAAKIVRQRDRVKAMCPVPPTAECLLCRVDLTQALKSRRKNTLLHQRLQKAVRIVGRGTKNSQMTDEEYTQPSRRRLLAAFTDCRASVDGDLRSGYYDLVGPDRDGYSSDSDHSGNSSTSDENSDSSSSDSTSASSSDDDSEDESENVEPIVQRPAPRIMLDDDEEEKNVPVVLVEDEDGRDVEHRRCQKRNRESVGPVTQHHKPKKRTDRRTLCRFVFTVSTRDPELNNRSWYVHARCIHLSTDWQELHQSSAQRRIRGPHPCEDLSQIVEDATTRLCHACRQHGAILKCYHPNCDRWYHSSCAVLSNGHVTFGHLDPEKPCAACPSHQHHYDADAELELARKGSKSERPKKKIDEPDLVFDTRRVTKENGVADPDDLFAA